MNSNTLAPKFSTIKKDIHPSTPGSLNDFPLNTHTPSDRDLIRKMQESMARAIKSTLYVDAIFFADKVLSLSTHHTQAVYDLANCFFLNGEYQRCIELLEKRELLN